MKNSKIIILAYVIAFILILFSQGVYSQTSSDKRYVKIIVDSVYSVQDARSIDLFLRNQPGIITSRMDYRTKLYFGIYKTSSGLVLNDFKTWIISLGYVVNCGIEEVYSKEKMQQLNVGDCDPIDKISNQNQN